VIAASILFLAAAIVTFLVGVFSSGLQMIGVSIGCSVAAAALLLTGVLRDSRRRPAVSVGAGAGVSQADVSTYATPSFRDEVAAVEPAELEPAYETAGMEEDESDLWSQEEEPSEEPSWLPELTSEPAPKRAARKPAARKTAAKKAAPKKAAPKKAAPKKAAPRKTAAKSTAKKAAPKSAAKKAAPKKAAPRKPSAR
jgi:hypothetical protein